MKIKTIIKPEETSDRRGAASAKIRAWSWTIKQGKKTLAGGYCRTKADAENDSAIWLRDAHAMQPNDRC